MAALSSYVLALIERTCIGYTGREMASMGVMNVMSERAG